MAKKPAGRASKPAGREAGQAARPADLPAPKRPADAPAHPAGSGARAGPVDRAADFEQLIRGAAAGGEQYVLRLYVTGSTPRSTRAIQNIRSLCERYLPGRYDLEVIDIYQQPVLARAEQIIAAPTLVKTLPPPRRQVIGDLSNTDQVLIGLDLRPRPGGGTG